MFEVLSLALVENLLNSPFKAFMHLLVTGTIPAFENAVCDSWC